MTKNEELLSQWIDIYKKNPEDIKDKLKCELIHIKSEFIKGEVIGVLRSITRNESPLLYSSIEAYRDPNSKYFGFFIFTSPLDNVYELKPYATIGFTKNSMVVSIHPTSIYGGNYRVHLDGKRNKFGLPLGYIKTIMYLSEGDFEYYR